MTIDESRELSSFVPDRLPEFVRVEHPTLVAFLSAYYEWLGLERDSGKILSPLALKDVADIDTTLDQFVARFKSQYLFNFPESLAINKETNLPVDPKQLIKNIKQFYLAKGTEKSYEFLFRIFFDAAVEFYYPKVDILRLSSGRWTQNNYIRVSNSLGNSIYRAAGNNVIQKDSDGRILATAKVISVDTFQIGNFPVAELLITARNGTFRTGDYGIEFEDGEEKFSEAYVYSVVSSVDIVNAGSDYQVGDRVYFLPQDEGQQAEGTVVEIDSLGGIRKINIDDFGINYRDESVQIQIDTARGSGFVGNVNLGSLCQSAGYYANNDGRLSTNKVLPDNQFYQNWSYVLKSEVVIDKYREIVRRLVHPVGTGMFGSVLIKRCAELDLQNASALMSYEVPLIGHYAPYTFNTFDDLSLWFDQGISNYEKTNTIYQELLTQFNSCFGETSGSNDWEGCKQFDYNSDSVIDGDDLGLFLSRWGDGPKTPGYSPELHNAYIQGIGSGYAVVGNPITNQIDFIGATSYNDVLKTTDFPNADPFWFIYTHPNKKVERGYHIAKIWKDQIGDFLNGDNDAPWHEWQYIREQRSQEQINDWSSFNTPIRAALGGTDIGSCEEGDTECICESCAQQDCGCNQYCGGCCYQQCGGGCNCDQAAEGAGWPCIRETCINQAGPNTCNIQQCMRSLACPEVCYEDACDIRRFYCFYKLCTDPVMGCGDSSVENCIRRLYCQNIANIGGHICECESWSGPQYPADIVAFANSVKALACGDCKDSTCCGCSGGVGNGIGPCSNDCACIEACPNFDPCLTSCSGNTAECNPSCPAYDPCSLNCPIPPDPCLTSCPSFDWCNCDPTGSTCCNANPCVGQCFDPCSTACTGYGPCHPTCPDFDPASICETGHTCYNACVCGDPCNQECPDFDWCNCDATGSTCCAANPCAVDCLDPCATACPGYGVCHPDCEQYDPCLCEGPCDPACPGNECNSTCPQYVSCNEDCPDYDPVACCQGCNCGNGGGIGAPIYRDPPTTITGGFPQFDPNENNPCLGVRTPCGLGVMQSNPYDFKYALLEYDENSEFRKITARAFFNMPQGQEFDCREESFGNVPTPKIVINSPIFGAVVNNPPLPNGILPSDYNYFRTFTVLFDIENAESLAIYRATEIKVYLNNRLNGTFGLNARAFTLKALRNGRHTIKIEIYDKTGKLIPGSQAISIFGYEFVPPPPPRIIEEVGEETL